MRQAENAPSTAVPASQRNLTKFASASREFTKPMIQSARGWYCAKTAPLKGAATTTAGRRTSDQGAGFSNRRIPLAGTLAFFQKQPLLHSSQSYPSALTSQ